MEALTAGFRWEKRRACGATCGGSIVSLLLAYAIAITTPLCFADNEQHPDPSTETAEHFVVGTAKTLEAGEIILGVAETGYGIGGTCDLFTFPVYDLLVILNAGSKCRLLSTGGTDVGFHGSVFYQPKGVVHPRNFHFLDFLLGPLATFSLSGKDKLHVKAGAHYFLSDADENMLNDRLTPGAFVNLLFGEIVYDRALTSRADHFLLTFGAPAVSLFGNPIEKVRPWAMKKYELEFLQIVPSYLWGFRRFHLLVGVGIGYDIQDRSVLVPRVNLDFFWRIKNRVSTD